MKTVELLILEAILEDVLDEAKIDRVLKANPEYSRVLSQMGDVKPKYLDWFMVLIKKQNLTDEKYDSNPELFDQLLETLIEDIQAFDKFSEMGLIKNKDIGSYGDLPTLQKATKEAEERLQRNQKKKADKSEKEVIYEDDTYMIIEPQSEGASCYYGKGTKWCISATDKQNMFDDYRYRGYSFVFIMNKKTNDKDALAYNPQIVAEHGDAGLEIYDSADKKMSVESFAAKHPTIRDIVYNHIGMVENIIHFQHSDATDGGVQIFTRPNREGIFVNLDDEYTYRTAVSGDKTTIELFDPDQGMYIESSADVLRDDLTRILGGDVYDQAKATLTQLLGIDVLSPEELYVKNMDKRNFSANNFYDSLTDLEERDLAAVVDAAKAKLSSLGEFLEKQFLTDWNDVPDQIAYMRRKDRVQRGANNVIALLDASERYPDDEDIQEIGEAARVYVRYFRKLYQENKDRLYSDAYNDAVRDSGYLELDSFNVLPVVDFNQIRSRLEGYAA